MGNFGKSCCVTIGCPSLASLGIQGPVLIQTSYVWSAVKGVKATGKANFSMKWIQPLARFALNWPQGPSERRFL